ncbi:MAG: polysaccharide export protein [Deltaproteobacteria bacterium]|nr:polysaccharide export protein [Deltaproteobacteria bacterium]
MTYAYFFRFLLGLVFIGITGALHSVSFAQQEDLYRIGPKDTLIVSVWKDENLTRQIVVPPDGVISFPLVDDIKAKDMTVSELRKVLTERLSEFIPDPTVNVMLMTANSMTAFVIGKVMKPGEFPIGMESNVMQILAMAGGLNPFAASTMILILRQAGGTTVKVPFNYEKVVKGEEIEQNILLRRGDVVVVP